MKHYSVEINAIIIAACVPTLRPLYFILLGKPGQEDDKSRKETSHCIPLLNYRRSIKLNGVSSHKRTFADDAADISCNRDIYPSRNIRHTFDVEINYDDSKYLGHNGVTMRQANSIFWNSHGQSDGLLTQIHVAAIPFQQATSKCFTTGP